MKSARRALDIFSGDGSVRVTTMSKTTIKWGAVMVGSLVILGLLSSSSQARPSQDLFAAQSTNNTDLHPVERFRVGTDVKTIVDAFKIAGKSYYPEDHILTFPDPGLGLGSVIQVERALPISIQEGKRQIVIRTWQNTLEEALSEHLLDLGEDDRISPALSTPLTPGMKVTITRVAQTKITEKEKISYEAVEKEDATMWRGERKVIQEGKNGERTKEYLVIREDGELKSKTLISNTITTKVVNKITAIGTKLKIGRVLSGKATWYKNSYGTKVAMDAFRKGVTVRITNLATGKSIIVVNDGCICGASNVLVDLAPEYFQQLGGALGQGVMASVKVEEVLN